MRSYPTYNNFDLDPCISVSGYDDAVQIGWKKMHQELLKSIEKGQRKFCFDLYPGVEQQPIISMLSEIPDALVFTTNEAKLPSKTLEDKFSANITDDRVFGVMTSGTLSDCFDSEAINALRKQISHATQCVFLVGVGASMILPEADSIWYWNITRWEIQLRFRRGAGNWLLTNQNAPTLTKYKIGFFIEWRLADRHKTEYYQRISHWVDSDESNNPKWISAEAFDSALKQTVYRPFHMQAYFDQSVWGGQWMKNVFSLDRQSENYGWSFDGVPEENALKFRFGQETIIFPALDLVRRYPEQLLGKRVYGRFGSEFPIRFDFLDTFEGGNLSLQVHPLTTYIQEKFGMHYTQDESYYIMDAEQDSSVYLGLKPGVNPDEMRSALESANAGNSVFEAEKYVNRFPVRKHDHVLIPAGTIHCSGRNTTVLEISSTPYIFTFKMWDWARLGLDGLPRPVHLDHGMKNIQFERDTDWVKRELLHRDVLIFDDERGVNQLTGLHELEFIDTHRYTVRTEMLIESGDSVTMINLVEGEKARISSPNGMFDTIEIHYAETFVIPAAVQRYKLESLDEGKETIFIAASVR